MKAKKLYGIKMRAAADGGHISGAENIAEADGLPALCNGLVARALEHGKGAPDEIHIKIEEINAEKIVRVAALPVTTVEVRSAEEGRREAEELLKKIGITDASEIYEVFQSAGEMRGAVLYDIRRRMRVDTDPARGVRVTNMDGENSRLRRQKNHFYEALILASKAARAPGVIAEICVSDDPDYVTGYVASERLGYARITRLKESGESWGGRIFLYDGSPEGIAACVDFLQNAPVLVVGAADSPEPAANDKWDVFRRGRDERIAAGIYRKIRLTETNIGPTVRFDGVNAVLMASNDYLNLASHPQVKAAAGQAAAVYGAGSGASRLISGTLPPHALFEREIAAFKGAEAALLFSSGYAANAGIIPALADGGVILSDKLNHASIIDGCRLSRARTVAYRHNDMGDLERKAAEYAGGGGLIVSDAVFSMDGDIADLPRILEIADRYGYCSMIDEAHSTGVLGTAGRGIAEHFGCRNPDVLMGTCSKALGAEGGFVCGSALLIDYLVNSARSFIFSTAPTPSSAAAAAALEILKSEPRRVRALKENARLFCEELGARGIKAASDSAIVPIIIGDERKAADISERLLKRGYFIPAVRYPTVAKGSARLRAALICSHTKEQIIGAAQAVAEEVKRKRKYGG